ncbi:Dabb family protein [Curtobacterium sp. PhB115]|uniref:Dabb family protein n=1 Tax=Curtobacterium sp. PhB115 TaxID=2485173 RepID=UPI000F4C6F87|nr:Dabb family protein [Curtobacterium sp. PhB115]ROP74045.1 stress responsive alpha/beta barrel protein [Curtobacterium sp. PhB115]
MIVHTVCFSLVHEPGSTDEAAFLEAARATLPAIPGVQEFTVSRQVSTQSDFRFQFSMAFADQDTYTAYDEHPSHQRFVATRWADEVTSFQELDFVPLPA